MDKQDWKITWSLSSSLSLIGLLVLEVPPTQSQSQILLTLQLQHSAFILSIFSAAGLGPAILELSGFPAPLLG